ncbi:hypothetical protein SCP_0607350 [Sparassis crispa]|uniref:Uncharacterized protein n=1 Tax=Sparassis crispa TaxID=139825 RepID=A0A401GRB3_9APHY|nr:hypothetical protein SCP_0607350 [Sparassis crispa]GBE84755.1 hypothetical protein SCP_0607350 [Sparassis crispa]
MESLLYVVLYCSLLWLDHNQSLQDLASRVCAIFGSFNTFDHAEEFRSSGGKLKNQYYRIFTSGVRFSDTAIQEWLHAVMRFDSTYMVEYPRDIALAKVWENPAEFNTFWTNFLDGRTISNCDRVSRQLAVPRERSNSWRLSNVLPPAPVRPPRKRRAIARDELVRANAECIIISAPSLPRPDYTGPTTRSMVKRRRIDAPEVGAGPSLDSGINSRSNPRCLRPRPAKPDLTQQGPKNDRSRKRA